MRDGYADIAALGADVVTVAPATVHEIAESGHVLPFPCLADPEHTVFSLYGVRSSLLSLGQRPAVFLIGIDGQIESSWIGRQQWHIPSVDEILDALITYTESQV